MTTVADVASWTCAKHGLVSGPACEECREEALDAAAQILCDARHRRDSLTPEAAAREAYVPGGKTVEELAAIIRRHRDEARAQRPAA